MSAKLNSLLKQVDAAAKEVLGAVNEIDARIAELHAKRQEIGQAPVSREDFLDYIGEDFDRRAGAIGDALVRGLNKLDRSFFALEKGTPWPDFLTGGEVLPVVMNERAAYWYLKPVILAKLEELVQHMDFPAADQHMTRGERRAAIAEIDVEIARLRGERDQLIGQLRQAGVAA